MLDKENILEKQILDKMILDKVVPPAESQSKNLLTSGKFSFCLLNCRLSLLNNLHSSAMICLTITDPGLFSEALSGLPTSPRNLSNRLSLLLRSLSKHFCINENYLESRMFLKSSFCVYKGLFCSIYKFPCVLFYR